MKSKTKAYQLLSSLSQLKWSIAVKGLLVGAVVGLLAVIYRLGIEYGTETAAKLYGYFAAHPLLILAWLPVIVVAGLVLAWLIRLEPMATGSGIPQVEGVVLLGLKMKWYSVMAVRFVGGILCSFVGLSLGREGPSIQIGAAGGQAVAKALSKSKLEEDYLITGGAAAGLSAAFCAPLSGMVFALEEIHRSFSPMILLSATAASLTADFVSKSVFGLKPILDFAVIPQLPMSYYLWLLPIGIVSGVTGSLVNKSLLGLQTLYGKLPVLFRPVIALLIALPVGLFLPQILGGGQNLIELAEEGHIGLLLLLVYFAGKLVFTATSFGSGVPGGIFLPILSIGALGGSILGVLATSFGLPAEYIPDFAVLGMAGALSSSVKAPVTAILLIAEMTGSLMHMLPVAVCSFIALLLSDLLKISPIYEVLLERYVKAKGQSLPVSQKGGIHEFPVELGSELVGKIISEVKWPHGLLIVSIRRGTKEIVPTGSTQILSGDYLVILSSESTGSETRENITSLCHTK